MRGRQFLVHSIQFDVGDGGIQRHLFAGILEPQRCGLHTGSRRVDVLYLGKAEDQRLQRCGCDRGRSAGKADGGRSRKPRAEHHARYKDILGLRQRGLGLLHIGFSQLDGARVALGQVNDSCQRDLGQRLGGQRCKRHSDENGRPGTARIVSDLHVDFSRQCFVS